MTPSRFRNFNENSTWASTSLFLTQIKLSNVFWPYFDLIRVTNAAIDRSKWQRPFTNGKYASRRKLEAGKKEIKHFSHRRGEYPACSRSHE